MRKSFAFVAVLLIQFVTFCAGVQVKDKPTLEESKIKSQAGEKKNWEAIKKALEEKPPLETPDLHILIIEALREIATQESAELVKKYLHDSDEKIRGMAIESLFYHQFYKKEDRTILYDEICNAIKANKEQFKKLTLKEIAILGKIATVSAVELLKEEITGEEKESVLAALQALAAIMHGEKEARKDSSEAVKLARKYAIEYLEKNSFNEYTENLLLEIYSSSYPDQNKVLMDIFNRGKADKLTMAAILRLLKTEDQSYSQKLIDEYKKEYITITNSAQRKKNLEILSVLMGQTQEQVLLYLEQSIKQKKAEMAILRFKKMEYKKALIELMTDYGFSNENFDKMNQKVIAFIDDKEMPQKAETVILFASLKKLKPEFDYFALKKEGLKGLGNRGLFIEIMSVIEGSYEKSDMRQLAVQKIFSLSSSQSEQIWKMYHEHRSLILAISNN